ncbi:hypothetical protein [Listeria phage LP-KV022]|uniref:Uncharacterized protein n=6 Tax=Homburgvirus TaxID=1921125 RepID=A0A6C0R154_9CAUD|nr:hypothetical protein P70_00107 [Listeria phage P70]YP_008240413.1 hypothetical protein LP110_049 [Listeria phage LP-110]YP_008240554.1 hypothetical protein LP037_076 [Listeria phage LP-037]YP_009045140.1 hypothetical protein LP114_086 [Listeria phage LP-114]AWY07742.1 hypothetical protein [Listeria phage LP-KV022]QHZ59437.1 hypothetical protein FK483_0094 [Listeria phage LP-018]AFQ96296.1 hypothetical protein P70_00107 [Listeria phage P70]AGI11552.1 hypothetical protein LP110_049 [Listeri
MPDIFDSVDRFEEEDKRVLRIEIRYLGNTGAFKRKFLYDNGRHSYATNLCAEVAQYLFYAGIKDLYIKE